MRVCVWIGGTGVGVGLKVYVVRGTWEYVCKPTGECVLIREQENVCGSGNRRMYVCVGDQESVCGHGNLRKGVGRGPSECV